MLVRGEPKHLQMLSKETGIKSMASEGIRQRVKDVWMLICHAGAYGK
jgi:hypothetical protein